MQPYSNTPSIRKRAAIAVGKKPVLLVGDDIYCKCEDSWKTSIVEVIYTPITQAKTFVRFIVVGYYWDVPMKRIHWQPLLMRWECTERRW